MVRKYHHRTLQTNPRHREVESPSNQLSVPLQDDCKTRMETKNSKTKTNTYPPQTMGRYTVRMDAKMYSKIPNIFSGSGWPPKLNIST